jgi:cell division protein ZapA
MDPRAVQLQVGGQQYRVVSSESEADLQRLADTLNSKLAALAGRQKPPPAQALLLVAMALAHELERERNRRVALEEQARTTLKRAIERIDNALASTSEDEGDLSDSDAADD